MPMTRRALPPNFYGQEWGGVEGPHEIMFAPALSVLPFLRYPLGYAIVHPMHMLRITLFMIAVPPITWALYGALLAGSGRNIPADTGHIYLIGFACLSFAISLILFLLRWQGTRRGEKIHTRETGYTWLAYHSRLPVPLCEMFVVPVTIGAIGWIIDDTISINLGRWLILSGCSMFGLAFWEGRRRWSQHRSAIDEESRAAAYERGFTRSSDRRTKSEPDIATLGEGLAAPVHGTMPRRAPSDQQRRDVRASGERGHAAAENVDDTLF